MKRPRSTVCAIERDPMLLLLVESHWSAFQQDDWSLVFWTIGFLEGAYRLANGPLRDELHLLYSIALVRI